MLSQVLEYVLFYSSLKKQTKLDKVHISAERKTYLVSLSATLVFKAIIFFFFFFEVSFYIKMQSKFHRFFSKTYLGDNLGPRLLCLFQLKDSSEGFCYSPSDQRSKDHCRRR